MDEASDPQRFNKDDFILRDRGRKYEDFYVGQEFAHHWGRSLDHADSSQFSVATCTWSPLYLNREFAIAAGHPECPINPALIVCVVVGLTVEDLSETAGPFLGMSDCIFDRSVYPGDTLTARSIVLGCRTSSSHQSSGVVTWRTTAENQRGEQVVSFVRSNLVAMRSPASEGLPMASLSEGA